MPPPGAGRGLFGIWMYSKGNRDSSKTLSRHVWLLDGPVVGGAGEQQRMRSGETSCKAGCTSAGEWIGDSLGSNAGSVNRGEQGIWDVLNTEPLVESKGLNKRHERKEVK